MMFSTSVCAYGEDIIVNYHQALPINYALMNVVIMLIKQPTMKSSKDLAAVTKIEQRQ